MASGFHWEVLRKAFHHSKVFSLQHSPWLGISGGAGEQVPSAHQTAKSQQLRRAARLPPGKAAAAGSQLV